MTRQKSFLFILLTLSYFVVTGQDMHPSLTESTNIDLAKISVKEYVALFKIRDKKRSQLHFLSIKETAPKNWIQKSDIEFLIKFVDSKEPANCVVQIRSSHLHFNDSSTVGGQVMNLIDSFRFNKDYPYFLDDCSKTDKIRVTDIKKWWADNSK